MTLYDYIRMLLITEAARGNPSIYLYQINQIAADITRELEHSAGMGGMPDLELAALQRGLARNNIRLTGAF